MVLGVPILKHFRVFRVSKAPSSFGVMKHIEASELWRPKTTDKM